MSSFRRGSGVSSKTRVKASVTLSGESLRILIDQPACCNRHTPAGDFREEEFAWLTFPIRRRRHLNRRAARKNGRDQILHDRLVLRMHLIGLPVGLIRENRRERPVSVALP